MTTATKKVASSKLASVPSATVPGEHAETKSTLRVNSAFLQEIKDSNPDLWHMMHQLRQLCESDESPTVMVGKLVRTLDDLRDRWALQFALEESYGYVRVQAAQSYEIATDARSQAMSAKAEEAHSEHCGLYLRLRDLAEQAEELQYRGVTSQQLCGLVSETNAFSEAIRCHEQREHELIECSFGADA